MFFRKVRKMENQTYVTETSNDPIELIELKIGNDQYGMNVNCVKEMIQTKKVTPIPFTHPFIKGVIDVRGEVYPVIDLGKVFSKESEPNELEDKFIISEINNQYLCFYVHGISQIHLVKKESIQPPNEDDSRYVDGIYDDIPIINVERIISDIQSFNKTAPV